MSERLQGLARALVGRPYVGHALVGGPQQAERLVADLEGFDCVTFVENVLALAHAQDLDCYLRELQAWRYQDGQVQWLSRLHYFSDWFAAHQRRGALQLTTSGPGAVSYLKTLSLLEDFPARRRRLVVVPRPRLRLAGPRIAQGSVVAFASTRSRIDYFHVGLLFWQAVDDETAVCEEHPAREKLMLYHAARSLGQVVAEPLGRFLRRNRMRGLSFAAVPER
ncbi:MAG: N-acetylmuramoyl-L-alanine amidase-like domain-containing protein [Pseudomonadota bacterium]